MSKKRTKNARKKAVKQKRGSAPRSGAVPIDKPAASIDPDWASEYQEPEIATPATPSHGGALGSIRKAVSPRKGTDGDTLLTKRRSVPELMVWLAGAIGVVWLIWKVVSAANADPQ